MIGRGGVIRTLAIQLPKLALYQAELRPVADVLISRRPARNGRGQAGARECPAQRIATGRSAVPATVPRIWFVVTK